MSRHQLTDEQWNLIADLFPPPKQTGRPRSNLRQMVDGVLWILNTGSAWLDLPECYGPKSTVWDHFDSWNHNGILQNIINQLRHEVEIDDELWCVDGTVVRAHKCAAGGGKKRILTNRKTTPSVAVEAA